MSDTRAGAPHGFHALRMTGKFIAHVGPLYLKRDGDNLWVGFRVEKRHTNPMDICHGGMLASFADMLLPLSIHRKSEVGMRFLPTISLQLDYLAPAPLGAWVQGEAQVLRVTRSLVFAQGLATADDTPILRVSGVCKIGPPFAGPQIDGDAAN
ncbi:MAG TPA: PaaI family thioesterase [Burkholderiaceae bacterium]|nr:PaaI family thioesterase [Burkholderiaceae bacterium]